MKTIQANELEQRLGRGEDITVVNVLSEESYREKHIPGSINVPREREDFAQEVEAAAGDKAGPVVVYCASTACDASPRAAAQLEQAGFENVIDFEAGVQGWEEAGYRLVGSAAG